MHRLLFWTVLREYSFRLLIVPCGQLLPWFKREHPMPCRAVLCRCSLFLHIVSFGKIFRSECRLLQFVFRWVFFFDFSIDRLHRLLCWTVLWGYSFRLLSVPCGQLLSGFKPEYRVSSRSVLWGWCWRLHWMCRWVLL